MSFEPEASIRLAVEQRDGRKVRVTILDKVVMRAPLTEDIRVLVRWVMNHQRTQGAILNGRNDNSFPHVQNKAEWTYDYFQDQVADANDDFSIDRLQHILEVRQYLRDKGHEKLAPLLPRSASLTRTDAAYDHAHASSCPRSSVSPVVNAGKDQSGGRFPRGKDIAIGAGIGVAVLAAFAKGYPFGGLGIAVAGGLYLFRAARKDRRR
ncbi:hypothetical protein [Azospirillum picis]|uniref:Uncharacterized protein n=1 Tax=Azospirillum picis TaxID=488438 RepID=A0ABU0MI42_9PROT|nr:hypothetical protein [Azospirillum picis]MBP2299236.1 hypothetical protein [Azospirillum picis]MDQ0533126.1 hypothetical protein [Azospirillum picis]